jgi:integrase
MPHYPKPFYREPLGKWYVQIAKKQIPLGADPKPRRDKLGKPIPPREVVDRYHELMASPPEAAPAARPAPSGDPLVATVLDEFLDWTSRHKAARTYAWYRENIQRFLDGIPRGLTVGELKPFHVTRAMDRFPDWSNNSKHNFIGAVKRALNWAADEELIDRSPLARVKKPAREAREMAVSPAEYARVLEAIREPNFRDLVELSWETGSRPQELRRILGEYFEPETGRIVFPPKQAKGKKYHRVIYLTPRAREIVARLVAGRPEGTLLVNSEGNPWTKDAINCAFCRLQIELGRRAIEASGIAPPRPAPFEPEGMPAEGRKQARAEYRAAVRKWHAGTLRLARAHGRKYHLGAFRKGFATEALKAGVDTVTVAHLMGHRDPSMVSKVYGHVQQDPEHMANSMKRAKGLNPGGGA